MRSMVAVTFGLLNVSILLPCTGMPDTSVEMAVLGLTFAVATVLVLFFPGTQKKDPLTSPYAAEQSLVCSAPDLPIGVR